MITGIHTDDAMHLVAGREETATIWYALEAYADSLEDTIKDTGSPTHHEDAAFCHATLGTIHRIMFAITEDHDPATKERIQRWLDV
jgi:hypothetical protein